MWHHDPVSRSQFHHDFADNVPHQLGQLLSSWPTATRRSAWSIYVHVPYCAHRCGYCDFNTYTAAELGESVTQRTYLDDVLAELRMAAAAVPHQPPVETIFFGGGTPTLLPASDLTAIVAEIRCLWGVTSDCEITTEANPESIDHSYLASLRAGGFTRLSLGMQSIVPSVLQQLDRRHDPQRALAMVAAAKSAGFEHISLDLIYGTPGENLREWQASLEAALSTDVDHISAYALTIEPGTAMGRALKRGTLPAPNPDEAAEKYHLADRMLSQAGFSWYEISNWAKAGGQCRHNQNYWHNQNWWGAGPGAHSHISGLRWWNVKHPRTYQQLLHDGALPVADFEELSAAEQAFEALLLGIRLDDGLDAHMFTGECVSQLVEDGLCVVTDARRLVLTTRGRLLADRVTLALADAHEGFTSNDDH